MTEKRFQKRVEDFVCENCGFTVQGTGYTDHCQQCLYSKHVDVNPGDRAAGCGGLMKVENVELKQGKYILVYKCIKCGHVKKNKFQNEDNMEMLFKIQKEISDEFAK